MKTEIYHSASSASNPDNLNVLPGPGRDGGSLSSDELLAMLEVQSEFLQPGSLAEDTASELSEPCTCTNGCQGCDA